MQLEAGIDANERLEPNPAGGMAQMIPEFPSPFLTILIPRLLADPLTPNFPIPAPTAASLLSWSLERRKVEVRED